MSTVLKAAVQHQSKIFKNVDKKKEAHVQDKQSAESTNLIRNKKRLLGPIVDRDDFRVRGFFGCAGESARSDG